MRKILGAILLVSLLMVTPAVGYAASTVDGFAGVLWGARVGSRFRRLWQRKVIHCWSREQNQLMKNIEELLPVIRLSFVSFMNGHYRYHVQQG